MLNCAAMPKSSPSLSLRTELTKTGLNWKTNESERTGTIVYMWFTHRTAARGSAQHESTDCNSISTQAVVYAFDNDKVNDCGNECVRSTTNIHQCDWDMFELISAASCRIICDPQEADSPARTPRRTNHRQLLRL